MGRYSDHDYHLLCPASSVPHIDTTNKIKETSSLSDQPFDHSHHHSTSPVILGNLFKSYLVGLRRFAAKSYCLIEPQQLNAHLTARTSLISHPFFSTHHFFTNTTTSFPLFFSLQITQLPKNSNLQSYTHYIHQGLPTLCRLLNRPQATSL